MKSKVLFHHGFTGNVLKMHIELYKINAISDISVVKSISIVAGRTIISIRKDNADRIMPAVKSSGTL